MQVVELRRWIEDALARHNRDALERAEEPAVDVTTSEIVDAVWGRLPLAVRREASRAQVQASLTMLSLRHRMGNAAPDGGPGELARGLEPAEGGAEDVADPGGGPAELGRPAAG